MENKKKEELKSSVKIDIQENTYEIKIPTVGQLLDIENMKSNITSVGFDIRSEAGAYSSTLAAAIAYFSVLIPDLKKDLTIDSLFKLDLVRSRAIVKAYVKQFKPWWDKWLEEINKDEDFEDEK